jgi:hypothetical protein
VRRQLRWHALAQHGRKNWLRYPLFSYFSQNLSEEIILSISTLKIDAVYPSETVVHTYRSTGHHNLREHVAYTEQLSLDRLINCKAGDVNSARRLMYSPAYLFIHSKRNKLALYVSYGIHLIKIYKTSVHAASQVTLMGYISKRVGES